MLICKIVNRREENVSRFTYDLTRTPSENLCQMLVLSDGSFLYFNQVNCNCRTVIKGQHLAK